MTEDARSDREMAALMQEAAVAVHGRRLRFAEDLNSFLSTIDVPRKAAVRTR